MPISVRAAERLAEGAGDEVDDDDGGGAYLRTYVACTHVGPLPGSELTSCSSCIHQPRRRGIPPPDGREPRAAPTYTLSRRRQEEEEEEGEPAGPNPLKMGPCLDPS